MCSAPDPAPMPAPAAPPPPPAPPVQETDVGSTRKAEDVAAGRAGGTNMRVDRTADTTGVNARSGGSGASLSGVGGLTL